MSEYTLELTDDDGSEDIYITADNDEIAKIDVRWTIDQRAHRWCSGGDWGDSGARIEVRWTLYDEDETEIDEGTTTVDIEPDNASLIAEATRGEDSSCGEEDDDHIWVDETSHSHGGTSMSHRSHCSECGLRRTAHSTGAQHNPGDHDTVVYEWDDE